MVILQNSVLVHRALFLNPSSSSSQSCSTRNVSFLVKAEHSISPSPASEKPGRRQALAIGAAITLASLTNPTSPSFAAEKGFLPVTDQKDGYEFIYPFGWQEVVIEGQDKVFKDVIEPLETASVNLVPTNKTDIKELGSPEEVAEALIKRVLAPTSQKTKLVEAKEHEVDGMTYYTFEFLAKAPNYTRHGLSAICISNGKFYTLTTGSNERRWNKMKDKLITVVNSFKVFKV
ncbi:phycocyanin alpha-subunit phycocyanobilin lyase [Ranunculus cassubicifolius]